MTFRDQILSDLPVFTDTDEFGAEITFAGQTVDALVIMDDITPDLDLDAHQGMVYIAVSDLSSAPAYRDVAVIDGESWRVFQDNKDRPYSISEGLYAIRVSKGERPGIF